MRGSAITPQPYTDTTRTEGDENNQQYYNYAFCWNGECYSYYKNNHQKVDSSLHSDTKLSTTAHTHTRTNLIQILDAANEEETRSDTKVVMEELKHTIESLYENRALTNCDIDNLPIHEMHSSGSTLNNDGGCGESTMKMYPTEFRKREHLAIAEELGHVHGEYSFILIVFPTKMKNHHPI